MLPIKGLAQAKNVTLQTSLVTALRSMRDGDKLVYVSSKDTPYEALTAYFEYEQPSGHVFLDKEKSAGAADLLVACAIAGTGGEMFLCSRLTQLIWMTSWRLGSRAPPPIGLCGS